MEDRPISAVLEPRRIPTQARAQKTVADILDTAAHLLEEVGVEGFNTNLLAKRAGVRVRTVYRYYPNKLAVITALAQQMVHEWGSWFAELEHIADPSSDWRSIWCVLIDNFVAGIQRVPGGLAIRRAMLAVPELRALDQQDNIELAGRVAAVFQARTGTMDERVAHSIARTLLESAVAIIDTALTAPPETARALLAQLKNMHLAYLARWLDETSAPSGCETQGR